LKSDRCQACSGGNDVPFCAFFDLHHHCPAKQVFAYWAGISVIFHNLPTGMQVPFDSSIVAFERCGKT
jgi:hypothetical protein